jgi:hypothetical protein
MNTSSHTARAPYIGLDAHKEEIGPLIEVILFAHPLRVLSSPPF